MGSVTNVSKCVYFRLPSGFILHFHKLAAPLFLLGFALPSIALTLGQPQGAVWVGRPLDLVVPVSLAEGESRDALCAEAELMQGSTRVDDRRVTVSVGAGASSNAVRLHVHSSVPVDEPVVQLTLRAGCQMNSSRQYVLLADMPSDVGTVGGTEAAAPRALPSVGARNEPFGVVRSGVPSSASSAGDADSGAAAVPAPSPRERVRPPAPRPAIVRNRATDAGEARRPVQRAAAPRRAVASAKPPVVAPAAPAVPSAAVTVPQSTASGARLQLEGVDSASLRNPAAAASAPLAGASAAVPLPAQGASAPAASDATAATAQTEELQRAHERLQSLEVTLKALREQSAQNQRMLMEMRSELAEARDSRYANPLVYLLVLLLLLALIALALLYRLLRNGGDRPEWWGDAPLKDDGGPSSVAPDAIEPPVANAVHGGIDVDVRPAIPSSASAASALIAEPVVNHVHFDDTVPQSLEEGGAPARYVNTEELFDVQQQSDFFVSLGQHDQAIAVLSEHIADNPETSALAYLDLLRIFHSLGRREDYARVASEFERAFNAEVPVFEQFAEVGNGLEHYRDALTRIEAQWPGPGTLGLIEELVFRKPGARGSDESFDLAAYRELLLLYSVAKEVIDPHSAPPTPVTPLSFLDTHDAGLESTMLAVDLQARHEMQDTRPDALGDDAAVTVPGAALPSIYGSLDEGMAHDTELAAIERAQREAANGIIDFDTTLLATTTTPAGLEPADASQRPTPAPSDWLSFDIDTPAAPAPLDLQLFDPATEAEIAPKPKRRS